MKDIILIGYPYVDIVLLVVIFVGLTVLAIWGFREIDDNIQKSIIMKCKNCGKDISDDSKYCNFCGCKQEFSPLKYKEEETKKDVN